MNGPESPTCGFDSNADLVYQNLLTSLVENAQLAALEITDGVDTARMQDMLESVRASVTRSSELLEHLIWHASRATDGEPYSDGGAADEFPQ